ncbi:beta-N-acetylhexosaminidase [Pelagibius sp.]|uniref:beta-N-acetylhexosaminidase n=1 Tax=Pelagibius sp. TaxID=1931238 RepID=UPI00260EAA8B|nr:beta-N-acetylhexosaminidase [Pelagibius sp.]
MSGGAAPRAVIYGCAGPTLSAAEEAFFRDADPLGFILFARNCESPDQVRGLVAALRAAVGRADAPVLIDQEGGRVARLKPPQWRAVPPPSFFGRLATHDRDRAAEALGLNTRLLAMELCDLGIDVDCVPVLDLQFPGASDVIGDRSFGGDPALVGDLGRIVCDTMLAEGVMPVVKHIPGHGRARVDSHKDLPVVGTGLPELSATDFQPFEALAQAPWGMTAHVVYTALDRERPATTSPKVISEVIRGQIGFQGLLLSDDLSMEALEGGLDARASKALEAGCDIALHCNGKPDEMEAIARIAPVMTTAAQDRFAAGRQRLGRPEAADRELLQRRLDVLMSVG